ncbi:hypothetical protein H010_02297 [Hydrogenophaga taeniospiralis CCUG 15921]|uniref:Lipoprotein LpqB C-terminal domain-containing protein n=1 Tax=Hydrogenophaga taeniospiralis CCUG 15921 TaxID=1281780 RepID=A0A9X4NMT3_9BURK|nr:LpqB family beta-propeller domain-containing protein [Hydrogenophaga taeniospiralis]MDG5974062.1 hypothetical protein [Hydrogenophaga taeniospiralis CCUG 15921]
MIPAADVNARDASPLPCEADAHIWSAIARIGRTEDLHFSPNNQRLALVGHLKNQLLVLDIEVPPLAQGGSIRLIDYLEVRSDALVYPHGVFWLDDQTLIVANRQGEAPVLHIPLVGPPERSLHIEPLHMLGIGPLGAAHTPGSVAAARLGDGWIEVLLCNNYAHTVSQHLLNLEQPATSDMASVLLADGLDIPDGIALSHDGRWIAVSNHNHHCVFVYPNAATLDPGSQPAGVLRGVSYPHGLRFTSDDSFILVADAGEPFVQLYGCSEDGWCGEFQPLQTLRTVDQASFLRGRHNPQEGGPKGIAIDRSNHVFATTCHEQPLAFFELPAVLRPSTSTLPCTPSQPGWTAAEPTRWARHLLGLSRSREQLLAQHRAEMAGVEQALEQQRRLAQDRLADIEALQQALLQQQRHMDAVARSHSWRITAPLRTLASSLRRWRPDRSGAQEAESL